MYKFRGQCAVSSRWVSGQWSVVSRGLRAALLLLAAGCGLLTTGPAQTIQFLNAAPSTYEDGTNVTIVVTRTPASGVATVDYTTIDDTATGGADYQFTAGTLVFNDGESFQVITVPIINDL